MKSVEQHDSISVAPKSSSIYKSGFGLDVKSRMYDKNRLLTVDLLAAVYTGVSVLCWNNLTYINRLYRCNKRYVWHIEESNVEGSVLSELDNY